MTLTSNQKGNEEIIEKPLIEPVLKPGVNTPQINPDVEVFGGTRNKSLKWTHLASDGEGIKTFEGFGYQPKGFIIKAAPKNSLSGACASDIIGDEDGVVGGILLEADSTTFANTRAIAVYGKTGDVTLASFNKYTKDGISLSFVVSEIDITFLITAL